jgi:hypothetical protein
VSCSGEADSSTILFHVNLLVIVGSINVSVALLLLVCSIDAIVLNVLGSDGMMVLAARKFLSLKHVQCLDCGTRAGRWLMACLQVLMGFCWLGLRVS